MPRPKLGKDRNLRVEVDSEDEFQILAASFNSMLDTLNKTSISEKHLSKILNNLYGALLVTDSKARIKSINATTSKMLRMKESQLIGKEIYSLFKSTSSRSDKKSTEGSNLYELAKKLTSETTMLDKDGREIPVYV